MSRSAEKLGRLGQFRLESHLCFFLRFSSIDRDLRYRSNGHDRIDEWSIDRVIDDWNEQKIYYFHGLESRNHESRLFNVLSTRINLDRKVRLTLWKSKCYFKIKYVHLTGITGPLHRFTNFEHLYIESITSMLKFLSQRWSHDSHEFLEWFLEWISTLFFSRTKNWYTSFNTNIHSWQSLVIRLINSDWLIAFDGLSIDIQNPFSFSRYSNLSFARRRILLSDDPFKRFTLFGTSKYREHGAIVCT